MIGTRVAVPAPGEVSVQYPKGREPQNMTAFRCAEREYKKKTFDRSACVDTRNPLAHASVRKCEGRDNLYTVGDTGFHFVPRAVDLAKQLALVEDCYRTAAPPNLSSLDAHYEIPASGLFPTLVEKKGGSLHLTRKPFEADSEETKKLPLVLELDAEQQMQLLRKLRWVAVGRQYNWTTKEYFDLHVNVPSCIADLCVSLCRQHFDLDFSPDAGIVNFYQPGDSLTGHVDRSERNMSVPLVSVSIGASCVFLLGGATREDPVIPVILHSGDAVFLAGPSRSYYHGVPRILESSEELAQYAKQHQTLEQALALETLQNGRININMRQI